MLLLRMHVYLNTVAEDAHIFEDTQILRVDMQMCAGDAGSSKLIGMSEYDPMKLKVNRHMDIGGYSLTPIDS